MGQRWGSTLHREHEQKIVASLRRNFGRLYQCPDRHFRRWWLGDPGELLVFRLLWLSIWEENEDGRGRVQVTVHCLDGEIISQIDVDVSRRGEVILPTPQALPVAA